MSTFILALLELTIDIMLHIVYPSALNSFNHQFVMVNTYTLYMIIDHMVMDDDGQ